MCKGAPVCSLVVSAKEALPSPLQHLIWIRVYCTFKAFIAFSTSSKNHHHEQYLHGNFHAVWSSENVCLERKLPSNITTTV
jgi:hypothetical protein